MRQSTRCWLLSNRNKIPFAVYTIICLLPISLFAQKNLPDSLHAYFTREPIKVDGKLSEHAWDSAQKIMNFTQRELHVGQPATEKTEIAVIYSSNTLYVGIWCFETSPEKIRAKYLSRDFAFDNDDNVKIALDTYKDKKNGFLFVINPNGARFDALISNNGDILNPDWNGVWDARTEINDKGWFAEIAIPFSTIRYNNQSDQVWGINFERNIRRKLEQDVFQGYSRNYQVEQVSVAGTLVDIKNIKGVVNWELKPYLLAGAEKLQGTSTSFLKNIGIDVNKNILNTLRLNLTVNTDFAQVEADKVQVNLTRFSIIYPEKRDFFNEGSGNFYYYLGEGNQGFYSRQIGISNFTRLPIYGGARIFGKLDRTDIGTFSIQTKEKDSIPSTNYSMLRLKQNIGSQSYVGMIAESKYNKLGSNQMYGVDGQYSNSHIFSDKNIVMGGHLSMTNTDSLPEKHNLAYRAFVDFPNDLIDNFIGFVTIQQNFNPEMGFLQRKNFKEYSWSMRLAPRWFENAGIKRMNFVPWDFAIYTNDTTGELESYYNEIRPFGFTTKSGDVFEFNLQQSYDHPGHDFNLTDTVVIKSGEYHMHAYEFQLSSYQGRKLFGSIIFNKGSYYGGHKRTIASEAGINFNKHFNFVVDYINNHVTLPQAIFTTHELSGNFVYAVNTKWDNSLFVQWNSEIDLILFNFRLHYIPKIGSDFYFVITQGFNHNLKWENSTQTTGVLKLVYRIAI
ncbi:MAG: hypothetical protein C5B52_17375 [Bacteroidetes bacterium]|nr:MAG: hypothetical protein C5B52_17375 [Bacteroidota bacterium]